MVVHLTPTQAASPLGRELCRFPSNLHSWDKAGAVQMMNVVEKYKSTPTVGPYEDQEENGVQVPPQASFP